MMLFLIIVFLGFRWSLEHVQMFKETFKCLSGLAEPVGCDRGTVQEACAWMLSSRCNLLSRD